MKPQSKSARPKLARPKLQPCRHYRYDGLRLTCIVVPGPMSGRGMRYDVLALAVDGPVIIGREPTLRAAREVIADYEQAADDVLSGYASSRRQIIRYVRHVCKGS